MRSIVRVRQQTSRAHHTVSTLRVRATRPTLQLCPRPPAPTALHPPSAVLRQLLFVTEPGIGRHTAAPFVAHLGAHTHGGGSRDT